jgi:hypothetical protein
MPEKAQVFLSAGKLFEITGPVISIDSNKLLLKVRAELSAHFFGENTDFLNKIRFII